MAFGTIFRRLLDLAMPRRPAVALGGPTGAVAGASAADFLSRRSMPGVVVARARVLSTAVARPKNDDAVTAFVASIRHLPLFSGTAMQLVRTIGRDDVTTRDLTRLIATDAALVAHLLRIVNSPYYGLAQRVGTVGGAISVLGFDQVRRTVTAAILQRPLMTYLHDSNIARAFWRHELGCAALSRHCALRRGGNGETAYMAGLMHDVGRLAMLRQFPEHIDVLLHVEDDGTGRSAEREFAQFGFDHAQVGGALLALWGLPPAIVEAAERHADHDEPDDAVSAAVWQANALTHDLFDDTDDELPSLVAVGLDAAARRRIVDEIAALEAGEA